MDSLFTKSFNTFKNAGIKVRPKSIELTRNIVEAVNNRVNQTNKKTDYSVPLIFQTISKTLSDAGFSYGDNDNFSKQLEDQKTDCQGNCFLYSLALDRLHKSPSRPDDYQFQTFIEPEGELKSHVVMSHTSTPDVWETTKPGFIEPRVYKSWGFTKNTTHPWEKATSLPEAIAVSHLDSTGDHAALFNFIDSLTINDSSYPSPNFYYRKKFSALEILLGNGKIEIPKYLEYSDKLLSKLIIICPNDLDLYLHKARIMFQKAEERNKSKAKILKNLNEGISLLKTVEKEKIHTTSLEQEQLAYFLLGHGFAHHYKITDNIRSKNTAIDYFHKAANKKSNNPEISTVALNNLLSLN